MVNGKFTFQSSFELTGYITYAKTNYEKLENIGFKALSSLQVI